MAIVYLLIAGAPVSIVHLYLVWRHSDDRRYSISEHAILDRQSHMLYIAVHILTAVFFLLYSHKFFMVEHHLPVAYGLNVVFAVLDVVQAFVPSKGRAERYHIAAAYTSWVCYVVSGLVALGSLHIDEPFKALAISTMIPVLAMFVYMHINRSKLYPYQLLMVPLYVLALLLMTIGARTA